MREGWFAFIPIERRMLIRWYWNAEAFATEGYGRKNKHLPRMNTEFHGKDRSRKLATERRHIFQSRMRERRFLSGG